MSIASLPAAKMSPTEKPKLDMLKKVGRLIRANEYNDIGNGRSSDGEAMRARYMEVV